MSTPRDQDLTEENQVNTIALQEEWVPEAAERSRIGHISGLDGASDTPAVNEIMAIHPTEVRNVGLERNPEEQGHRGESVDGHKDSDTEPVEEKEQQQENADDQNNVDHFQMAGLRIMFLDLIHAILNLVYHNNHGLIRRPHENQVTETPVPSTSDHSSQVQIPLGPTLSRVRAAEYESNLPEVISTFPELEEPEDFEDAEDHCLPELHFYVQKPAVGTAVKEPAEKAGEEVAAAAATAEEPEKKIMEQIMAPEGDYHCDIGKEEETIFDGEKEKGEKENQEALGEAEADQADYGSGKSRSLHISEYQSPPL